MTQGRIVKVSGIPARKHEEDLLQDKLTMHFLRRKNGGDGEVNVRYPTEEEGVAMLTFDLPEVAHRVLARRHRLEVDECTYPLEVSRPQLGATQFLMPVTASLNVLHFDDTSEVKKILERHNLKVCREERFCLHVEGDFQDLDRCREELYKTLSSPYLSRRPHSEDRRSRRDKHYTSPEDDHISREEAYVKKLSPGNSARPKTSEREPSPRRALKSLPPDVDSYSSTAEKKKTPNIKQPLTQISRPINSPASSSQRKAKERSSDDSTTNQPRSKMAANLNFYPVPPNKTSAEENRRAESSSLLVSSGGLADGSRLGSHMTLTGPIVENLSESGQPKGTSRDAFTSSPRHHMSTRDNSYMNSGQDNKVSVDKFDSNPKHPKSTTNSNSGKPQNSSVDEFFSNPSNPVTMSNFSTSTAAGWSPSSSPPETATSSKKHLDQSPPSTELLVDPAVHTYINVFVKDSIDDVLGQSVEMKIETCEGYNRVILTAKSPDHSQIFYKASREISDIFTKWQKVLREQRIDLSNMSVEETKWLHSYLYKSRIWSMESSSATKLHMIGPSKNILAFMEKWTSARNNFEVFVRLSQRGVSPVSSRPPVVGTDNVSITHDNNETREGRRLRDQSKESGTRGDQRRPDTNSRSNTPNSRPWR